MHYKNGREAKVSDHVVGRVNGNPVAGTVVYLYPGATSCNITVSTKTLVPLSQGVQTVYGSPKIFTDAAGKSQLIGDGETCANCDQFIHAEDAMAEVEKAIAAAVPPSPQS